MKYELTQETIEWCGHTLRRVRYLKTSELGGWAERLPVEEEVKSC